MGFTRSMIETEGKEIVALVVNFRPQGTGAPTINDASTGIKSVSRSAAGRFLLTFSNVYKQFLGATATTQLAANNVDLVAQCGTFTAGTSQTVPTSGTAPTLIVRLMTGTTETDLAADANDSVSVTVWFRRNDSNLK